MRMCWSEGMLEMRWEKDSQWKVESRKYMDWREVSEKEGWGEVGLMRMVGRKMMC